VARTSPLACRVIRYSNVIEALFEAGNRGLHIQEVVVFGTLAVIDPARFHGQENAVFVLPLPVSLAKLAQQLRPSGLKPDKVVRIICVPHSVRVAISNAHLHRAFSRWAAGVFLVIVLP